MSGIDSVPSGAREDVAYLARSENRVQVLDALSRTAYTRRDLRDAIDTSRSTLGRILTEFEERGWAERTTDGAYRATPQGRHLAAEITPLFEAVTALRDLGNAVALLPTDELSIGHHHFSDATVRRPDSHAGGTGGRFVAESVRDASTIRVLSFVAPPRITGDALQTRANAGAMDAEMVFTEGLFDYLRAHPDEPPRWQDLIEAGTRMYRYDGRIPCNLFVMDEMVLISRSVSDPNEVGSFIETRNDTVRQWALEVIEEHRDAATQIDPAVL